MFKLHESQVRNEGAGQRWHVKFSEDCVFGPVGLPELRDWAEQGRIVAGNLLSRDRESWMPAESLPELDMMWVAELGGRRRFGPFNLATVPLLVKRGKINRATPLQHCSTGEVRLVSSVLESGAKQLTYSIPAPVTVRTADVKTDGEPRSSGAEKGGPAAPVAVKRIQDEGLPDRNDQAHKALRSELSALQESVARAKQELEMERVRAVALESAANQKQGHAADVEKKLAAEKNLREEQADRLKKTQAEAAAFAAKATKVEAELNRELSAATERAAVAAREVAAERSRAAALESAANQKQGQAADIEKKLAAEKKQREEQAERLKQAQFEAAAFAAKATKVEAELKRELSAATERAAVAAREVEAERSRAAALEAAANQKQAHAVEIEKRLAAEMKLREDQAGRIDKLERELKARAEEVGLAAGQLDEQRKARAGLEAQMRRSERDQAERSKQSQAEAVSLSTKAATLEAELKQARSDAAESAAAAVREGEERIRAHEALQRELAALQERAVQARREVEAERSRSVTLEYTASQKEGHAAEIESKLAAEKQQREGQSALLKEARAKVSAVGAKVAALEKAFAEERHLHEEVVRKWLAKEADLSGRIGKLEQALKNKAEEAVRAVAQLVEQKNAHAGLEERGQRRELDLTGQIGRLTAENVELQAGVRQSADELARARAGLARAAEASVELMQQYLGPQGSGKPTWYLQGDDKSVYGPVDLSELWAWACQSRIGPKHSVSQDKKNWVMAETIPELHMEWICKLPDGVDIGPLNPFAYRDLVADGSVDPGQVVQSRLSGETIAAGALVKATEGGTFLRRTSTDADRQKMKDLEACLAQARRELEEASGRSRTLEGAIGQKEGQVAGLEKNLAAEKKLREDLAGRIDKLERALKDKTDEAGRAAAQLGEQKKEHAGLEMRSQVQELELKGQIGRLTDESSRRALQLETEKARAVQASVELMQQCLGPQGSGTPSWYLQGDDMSVYGPVDLPQLWAWACQSRIGPKHSVSQDKKNWVLAETVPELRMEWICKLPDGADLGPLNPFAFRDLVADGFVDPGQAVQNHLSGETIAAGELVKATEGGALLRHLGPGPDGREWKQRCSAAEERGRLVDEELARVGSLFEAEKARRLQLEHDLLRALEELAGATARFQLSVEAQGQGGAVPPRRLSEKLLAADRAARALKGTKG
jgi:hypothetical protein